MELKGLSLSSRMECSVTSKTAVRPGVFVPSSDTESLSIAVSSSSPSGLNRGVSGGCRWGVQETWLSTEQGREDGGNYWSPKISWSGWEVSRAEQGSEFPQQKRLKCGSYLLSSAQLCVTP